MSTTTHVSGNGRGDSVVLMGNPNVGKSVLFSLMTGSYVSVSNYPGTTVEITSGVSTTMANKCDVIDTPGINSLLPMSEDERVSRDILLKSKHQAVVQVVDAKNLRRALLITTQLAEMQAPVVLCLNMHDEAKNRGIEIDEQKLAELLGVQVITTVATHKVGIDRLVQSIAEPRPVSLDVDYPKELSTAADEVAALLPEATIERRSLALMLLARDRTLQTWLEEHTDADTRARIEGIIQRAQEQYQKPLGVLQNIARMAAVDRIVDQVYRKQSANGKQSGIRSGLEMLSGHPVWGVFVLLGVLSFMYWFVGVLAAGEAVDFLESVVFGEYVNPWVIWAVEAALPWTILQEFIVGEYGIFTMAITYAVAIVLPIVFAFFMAFNFLEDSGYLPRLAMMLDRLFRMIGLNGKAVLPMVLGLGCDTMATMTTRILETRKERIIVMLLLALGVPCSAQLGVIGGMMSYLSGGAVLFWVAVIVGVITLVGYLAAKILPGENSDFIMELPPFRWPRFSNILIKTTARLEWYLREIVPLFVIATAALFVLDKTGALGWLRDVSEPVVQNFLGLPAEAADAFLIGFFRRDYGAAGLFMLARNGMLDSVQTMVSIITITLFVPCVANVLIIVKEQGKWAATAMVAFIFPFAFVVGGLVNQFLRFFGITF
jgi:ferrous iron transport protein B